MAAFKVGDRVRITACTRAEVRQWVGTEDTIIGESAFPGDFYLANAVNDSNGFLISWRPYHLEPLTPPKQQETLTWDECCFDRNGKYRWEIAA